MRYVQVVDGRVHGVFEYETLPDFAPNIVMIPCGDPAVSIGWRYSEGEFTPPLARSEPTNAIITRLAFLSRFTDAEAVALDLASIGATVEAATLRRYMAKVNAATFIDLSREDTRAGVLALETMGILAEGRALEILDSPVQSHEVPR